VFPKDFNRIIRGPDGCNASIVAFEFCPRDGGICVVQVGEHGIYTDIGKAKDVIIESSKIDAINSGKDLFFDLFCNCCGSGQFFECGVIEVCGFCTGSSICAGGMLGCWARVHGELKLNTSKSCVGSVRHDKSKVTMESTAMHGRDGMCIGVDFFGEKFDGGICRCDGNSHECWVWECEG